MKNIIRNHFQSHPFHLVSPSQWPIFTSFALLTLTTSGVLYLFNKFYTLYYLFNNLPPKPYGFIDNNLKCGIEIVLNDEVLQLLEQINSWIQSKNLPDFVTVSQEVSKNDWFSICSDEDLKSSTFLDLQSDSTVNKKLTDVDNHLTDKTYYLDTLFGWLDDKFSFLKQDFGKLFPNSVYAMQDFNALRPQDTDLTVMFIDNIENNASNIDHLIGGVTDNVELGNFNTIYSDIASNTQLRSLRAMTNLRYIEHYQSFRSIYNLLNSMWPDHHIVLNTMRDIQVRQVLHLNMEQFVDRLYNLIDDYQASGHRFFSVLDNWERYPNYGEYLEHVYLQPRHIIMDINIYNEITSYVNPDTGVVDEGLVNAMGWLVDIGVIVLR